MSRALKFIAAVNLLFTFQSVCWGIEESIFFAVNPQEGGGAEEISSEILPTEKELTINIFDNSRDWLKSYIDSVSLRVDGFFIDTFFGDDILEDDVSGSRAKLSFSTRRVLGEPVGYKFGVSVKLVLPNTDEKLNLLLESSEDEDEERENNVASTVENVEYSTALRYIFTETERWRVNFDTGVRWGIPSDPFAQLKLRRYAYYDDFRARTTQTVYWSGIDGYGEKTSFELNRPLNIDRLLRFNMAAEYLLNNDYFDLDYSVSLFHELNKKEVFSYFIAASGDTIKDATFNSYQLGVRYRRKVYQDWMFVEFSPVLETSSEKEYDITPVIMFSFEALIGDS